MACYHPMYRLEDFSGHVYICGAEEYDERAPTEKARLKLKYKRMDLIPCGKCIGCRLKYSADWATRIMCESEEWQDNWFLTLTYDDVHLPYDSCIDTDTGEMMATNPTLDSEHLTRFMKSLRKRYERQGHQPIRFYACGEYGSKYDRPHYHLCIFNMPIEQDDLKEIKKKDGHIYYTVEWLEKLWGQGYIIITDLSWETAAYTARYMLKKQLGNGGLERKLKGQEPEFTRMSRRPGIGANWISKHADEVYKNDGIAYKGRFLKPPAYFDEKYDLMGGDIEKIKEQRKKSAERAETVAKATDSRTRQEVREIKERSKAEQIRMLRREI